MDCKTQSSAVDSDGHEPSAPSSNEASQTNSQLRCIELSRASRARLSRRQLQILQLICEGQSTKEIVGTLRISRGTVDAHRAALMKKARVRNLAGLVVFAFRAGVIRVRDAATAPVIDDRPAGVATPINVRLPTSGNSNGARKHTAETPVTDALPPGRPANE